MKTTENISLGGYAFTIESDAYEELNSYIKAIHHGFEGDESADEIMADIEERIAELLSEKYRPGMVVNMGMVLSIEERIGKPDDFAADVVNSTQEESQDKNSSERKSTWGKRLYRNIDERILGGVCGGLGAYFNIDKVLFRILFLILVFIGFANEGLLCVPVVAYIGLWIAMPAARTVEQKCEMKGKPIKLDSFRSKDYDLGREVREASESPAIKIFKRVGGIFLGVMLLIVGISGLLGSVMIPVIPEIFDKLQIDQIIPPFSNLITDTTLWVLLICYLGLMFIWMVYNGIMLTFGLNPPSWKPGLVLMISWLICLLALIAWSARLIVTLVPEFTCMIV